MCKSWETPTCHVIIMAAQRFHFSYWLGEVRLAATPKFKFIYERKWSVGKCSCVKFSEGLRSRVSNIIWRYKDHMGFVVYIGFSFIVFFHILLFQFLSLSICSVVCTFVFNFVKYVFCIVTFVYSYRDVYVFLLLFMCCSVYSVSLCCSMNCLCVNGYCKTATGCLPNCS